MWQIRAALIAMAGILFVLVPGVRADSLQLKNGNFVQGKYLGGTERAVQFAVNGKIHLYGTDEILSISFAAASADGGIPSNNVDPKPSANTELNSAAKDNRGSRVALWNQTKAPKAPAQQATWEQKQYRGGSSPRVGRPGRTSAIKLRYSGGEFRIGDASFGNPHAICAHSAPAILASFGLGSGLSHSRMCL
jgi:hypothetical protein